MFNVIRQFFSLTSKKLKYKTFYIFAIFLVAIFLESASILSISPIFKYLDNNKNFSGGVYENYVYDLSLILNIEFLNLMIIISLIVLFISTIIVFLCNFVLNKYRYELTYYLSNQLFKKYIEINFENFTKKHKSFYLNNLTNEINRVSGGIIFSILNIYTRSIYILCLTSILFFVNKSLLFLIIIIFFSYYLLIYLYYNDKIRIYGQKLISENKDRIEIFTDTFEGFKDVRSYSLLEKIFSKLLFNSKKLSHYFAFIDILNFSIRFFLEFLIFFIILLLIYLSTNDLIHYDIETVVLFILIGLKLLPSTSLVYNSYLNYINNLPSFENIMQEFKFLKKISKNKNLDFEFNDSTYKEYEEIKSIKLRNLSFGYGEKQIFENVNLTLKKGEIIGLVGASGSGKSTLINLLAQFYEPSNGELIINGKNSKFIDINFFWKITKVVDQNYFFFQDTIINNIFFNKKRKFSEYKKLFNFIISFKLVDNKNQIVKFLKSKFGKNFNLSEGQKQRLSILRALMFYPQFLILDEPSSAIDFKNLEILKKEIKKVSSEMIILISTHDENLFNIFDRIYTIKNKDLVDASIS